MEIGEDILKRIKSHGNNDNDLLSGSVGDKEHSVQFCILGNNAHVKILSTYQ